MLAVQVLTGGEGVKQEVAVIEFWGQREESIPGGDGAARIYDPLGHEPTGYRLRSGSVPDDVVQEVYRGVCQMKATDTVGEFTWRRL
jgi:hypothetical protein